MAYKVQENYHILFIMTTTRWS